MHNISKTNQGYSFDSRQRIEGRKKKSNSHVALRFEHTKKPSCEEEQEGARRDAGEDEVAK